MKQLTDLKYGPAECDLFDLFLPDGDCFDLLIWLHGGGLESGNRKGVLFHSHLCENGIGVASVEYRMYPEVDFPVFIKDCAKAASYILHHLHEYGQVGRVFIGGQSAGAYITLMLALDESYFEKVGINRGRITGYISDSAQVMTHYNVLRERGMDSRLERVDAGAPLYYLSASSRFNNLLLICYDDDIPCRPEENLLLYKYVQRLCPEQNVQFVRLPGSHCNGSLQPNERGTYDFSEAMLAFIGNLEQ